MFKNLILYRISPEWQTHVLAMAEALHAEPFVPCGPTQPVSAGWVPPRGEPGAPLIELVDGQWLLQLCIERRVVPADALKKHVQAMADKIEAETGRRPGKKQLRDLKEQATLELLPRAFTRQRQLRAWIDPQARLLVVDSPSIGKADDLISLLVRADKTLNLHLLQSAESPSACMAAWLMDGLPPAGFTVDRDLELKAADEMKSLVRYGRHNLDTEEVRQHLVSGKAPTRLAMTWRERLSFTLTDVLTLRAIKFLDIVFDGRDKMPAKDEAFDVDVALATGELRHLLPALVDALGGELDFIGQAEKVRAKHAGAEA